MPKATPQERKVATERAERIRKRWVAMKIFPYQDRISADDVEWLILVAVLHFCEEGKDA